MVLSKHLPACGLAVLSAALPLAAQSELRTLTPAQMEEDLLLLFETFEREHGGLTRFTSREEIDEAFGETLYACGEELSIAEYHRLVARLVSLVRCGHTRVSLGGLDRTAILEKRGLLPFEVHLVGDRMWILSTVGDAVPLEPGQEILSIDGRSIPEVRRLAFLGLFGDGFVESHKARALERDFSEHYALLVDDLEVEGLEHELELAGFDAPVTVRGITLEAWGARPRRAEPPPLFRRQWPAEDVAYLFVRGFGDPGGDEPDFPTQLEAAFREFAEKGAAHLILDLRGNGGGADMYGALLVSYMSDEPFGYFERIEVSEHYEGPGGVVERDGMRLVTEHPGLQVQQPAEHRFGGPVYVLTDGWTFSTAADVAAVAHHNGLATFVGEETGGGYDGNTSGVSRGVTLGHSGLAVNVPCWMYTTKNVGHDFFGRGVIPDHPVRPSIEDALTGRDAELELVLALIRGE